MSSSWKFWVFFNLIELPSSGQFCYGVFVLGGSSILASGKSFRLIKLIVGSADWDFKVEIEILHAECLTGTSYVAHKWCKCRFHVSNCWSAEGLSWHSSCTFIQVSVYRRMKASRSFWGWHFWTPILTQSNGISGDLLPYPAH